VDGGAAQEHAYVQESPKVRGMAAYGRINLGRRRLDKIRVR
jgi:hypothetical protein